MIPLVLGAGHRGDHLVTAPLNRNLGEFLSSDAGKAMFHGSWGLFALVVTMFVFNTVLGEELLFRGVLLPRMNGAFGDRDWVANGVLFADVPPPHAVGHPGHARGHVPRRLPGEALPDALIGIAVHSAQTMLFTMLLLTIVI